ncbi:MAG TPA: hypothetical protein VFN26_12275 [Candidatus Acidoferrum sp.]|nr:hypothetical protein [Candidatus Acidoferrum sp.]
MDEFRKAVRLSSTLWGGKFNPIIPVGPGNTEDADELLRTFNVDALFPLTDTPEVTQFVQRANHLPWPDIHERSLFIQGAGGPLPVLLDVYHPVRKLGEEREKREVTAPDGDTFQFNLLMRPKTGADPLSDALLATLGDYPDGDYCPIDYAGFADRSLGAKYLLLDKEEEVPRDYWSNLTPIAVTEQDLLVYKSRGGHDTPGVFVGDPASFSDLVTFWNLRAADIQVTFFPEQGDQRLVGATRSWLKRVMSHLEGSGHFIKVPALWCTSEKDYATHKELFDGGYSIHRVSDGTWNGLNVRPPRVHFEQQSVLGTIDKGEGSISVSFSLPTRPFLEAPETEYQHVIVSVRPLIDPEPALGTFHLPNIPQLNQFYGRKTRYDHSSARIEPEALGTVLKLQQSHLQLNGVSIPQLLVEVFRLAGITAKQSAAGKIALRIIQHMGGLDNCRVFKIAGVRGLLHEFTASKSFTHDQALARIGKGFEPHKKLFIEPREERDLEPQDVFLHLVRKRILRTGVVLECPTCGLGEWCSLNDLAEEVSCPYCGAMIDTGPQLRDGLWHYRVSGLFARTRDQEGAIPVALALLQALRCLDMRGMTWLTGMDLTWAEPGKNVEAETDLVVLTRNYENIPEILLGECKTNKELEVEQIERLVTAAKRLTDSGVKTFVLFAKAGSPFSAKELELIDARQTIDLNFILLTPTELEPYSPYENVKVDKARSVSPHTLEDWAEYSRVLYLKTPPEEVLERHMKSLEGAG